MIVTPPAPAAKLKVPLRLAGPTVSTGRRRGARTVIVKWPPVPEAGSATEPLTEPEAVIPGTDRVSALALNVAWVPAVESTVSVPLPPLTVASPLPSEAPALARVIDTPVPEVVTVRSPVSCWPSRAMVMP